MRIAVFDHLVTENAPAGKSLRRLLEGLCHEHELVVFSVELDNPEPALIRHVRIPAPRRPLVALYLVFHLLAPVAFLADRLRHRKKFDLVLTNESNVLAADIAWAHFCHRAFLDRWWPEAHPAGLRRALRWLDHHCHALAERVAFSRARIVVAPSSGLARELAEVYPSLRDKVRPVAHSIDIGHMTAPPEFSRSQLRGQWGCREGELVLVFVALGHWERKGLPLVLEAMRKLGGGEVRLVVVGGVPDYVKRYRKQCGALGLGDRTVFVGNQGDVRRFLWAADALILPTAYEIFANVCLEAAAAGLPQIVTRVYGVEEYLRDGENAIIVERTVAGVKAGIERFAAMTAGERAEMGRAARAAVSRYTPELFVAEWRAVLEAFRVG